MTKRRSRTLGKADRFRALVGTLHARRDVEWRPYEDSFLETQLRRPDDYIFSDEQWRVLNQLVAVATLFTHYADKSVPELLAELHLHRSELDLPDEEFVERHYLGRTASLPVRDIRRLARLYRCREALEVDETAEAVFRQTWAPDGAAREYDEYTAFPSPA